MFWHLTNRGESGYKKGVSNGNYAQVRAHREQTALVQSKVLEAINGQPGGTMDIRAAQAAERSNQAVEAVGASHRAKVA